MRYLTLYASWPCCDRLEYPVRVVIGAFDAECPGVRSRTAQETAGRTPEERD